MNTSAIAPRMLRTKEAAQYLRIGAEKLRQLAREGKVSVLILGDETSPWLFDVHELDEWIKRTKTTL